MFKIKKTKCTLKCGSIDDGGTLLLDGIPFCKIPANQIDDFAKHEAKTLQVEFDNDRLLMEGAVLVKDLSDPFNLSPIVDLINDNGVVRLKANSIELSHEIKVPTNLFKNRNTFKIVLKTDSQYTIVRYTPIHTHSEFSTLDGINKLSDIAKKTEYAGALTDHGNMFGYWQFYRIMKKAGKKPIIGMEAYIETINDDSKDSETYKVDNLKGDHIILLAKNEVGLKNLFKLSSRAYENFYSHAHITYEMLEEFSEGLIATSACVGGTLGYSIRKGDKALATKYINKMVSIFGKDDFYIELQNHHIESETEIMKVIKEIAKKFGFKTVVGIDSHYTEKDDDMVHDLWLCKSVNREYDDPNRFRFEGDGYYYHTSDEVLARFPDDQDALDNTLEIADKCNVEIEFDGYHIPNFPLPSGYTEQGEYFSAMCMEGFKKRYAGTEHFDSKEYKDRLDYEMSIILKMGYPSYFLIVADFIKYAKDSDVRKNLETYFPKAYFDWDNIPEELLKDYPISIGPGRGSAAGSLVSYCLEITDVDPIKYGLLFERFLAVERISMPDIDVDISDEKREIVLNYVRHKFGHECVSRIVTFGTSAAKSSVKTVAKVLGYSFTEGQKIADLIPSKPGTTLTSALEESKELEQLLADNPSYKSIYDKALKIEGLKTFVGQHACGVIIAPSRVDEFLPQLLIADDKTGIKTPTTQLTMAECEDMGLLKMDFLGLKTLTVIDNTISFINNSEKAEGFKYNAGTIPLNDVDVYKFIGTGQTAGVFQIESPYMRSLMKELYQDIESNKTFDGDMGFMRLSDANALGRPGPMEEIPNYIENMLNPHMIPYENAIMKKHLQPTNGIITYQEQLMFLVRELAGFSAAQADMIRKGMSKKVESILTEYGEYFVHGSKTHNIVGCVANGMAEEVAVELWEKMKKFGKYAFNKSHSVSYSMITARTAYLAYYYPTEFLSATLNAAIDDVKEVKKYISACQKRGINVLPPSINQSGSLFEPAGDNIVFGLKGLKGLGSLADLIASERKTNGLYKDIDDFIVRISKYKTLSEDQYESLIMCGAFDDFGGTRKEKIANIGNYRNYSSYSKDLLAINQMSWGNLDTEYTPKMDLLKTDEEFDKAVILTQEYEKSGFYISGHPLDNYQATLKHCNAKGVVECLESENKKIIVAGVVKELEKKITKKTGDTMFIFKIEDKEGMMSCTLFPRQTQEFGHIVTANNCVILTGNIESNDFGTSLIVDTVRDISSLAEANQIKKVQITLDKNINKAREQFRAIRTAVRETEQGDTSITAIIPSGKEEVVGNVLYNLELISNIESVIDRKFIEVTY